MQLAAIALTGSFLASMFQSTIAGSETLTVTSYLPTSHVSSVHVIEKLMSCVTERTKGEVDFNY